MPRVLLVSLLWIATWGALPGAAQEIPDTVDVAVLEDWPPHFETSEDGTPRGFAVDVVRAVADREGFTIRFVPLPTFPDAIEALADGSVDVIPDFGITPSREEAFLFTRPFDAFDISVFVRESDPATDASDDFAGRRIGTVRSNVGVGLAAARYPEAERIVYDNVREAMFELIAAGVDAVVYPEEVFLSLARSGGLEDRFRILTPPLAEVSRAMGVRPGDTALAATLDRGLEALVGTEEYEAMVRRWFEPAEPFWTMRRVLWLGGILLLAILVGMAIWRYRSISVLAADLARVLEERDAAREVSRQEEERFQAVVETAYEGIVVSDAENRITFVNQRVCELVGIEEEDLVGESILTHVHPDDHDRIREGVARRHEGISESYEIRIRRSHGDHVWVLLSVAPFSGQDGDFAGSVATLADITARIEAERELEERERRFRAFVEKASDLISTLDADGHMEYQSPPLERILGYDPEDLGGRSVFDLMHPEDREMAEDAWSELVERPGSSVQIGPFRFRHKDGSWRILINARDAMPEGGTLTLSTYAEEVDVETANRLEGLRPGHYTVLCMADTGVGMDEETRARVFEPFFTTKGRDEGTGLGLAMAYGFVKQSGGFIYVESEPGEGATFVIRFPTVDGEPATTPRSPEPARKSGRPRGAILVVEDDDSVRRVTVRILEQAGCSVIEARDAESALELVEARDDLALVLTDLGLPAMSGRRLADRIGATRPGLPILVMSGYAEDSPGPTGDLPVDIPFLQKPFTPERLLDAVYRTLESVER